MRRQQPPELALRCHQQPLESPGGLGLAQVTAHLPGGLIRDQLMQGAAGYKSRGSALLCWEWVWRTVEVQTGAGPGPRGCLEGPAQAGTAPVRSHRGRGGS